MVRTQYILATILYNIYRYDQVKNEEKYPLSKILKL